MRVCFKYRLIFFLVVFACLFSEKTVFAQAALNLPRILEQNGRFTGIAMSNPSNLSASVTLQLYSESGNPVPPVDASKSATFKLGPGAQLAQFENQMFSLPPNFRGWAQIVSSDSANLRGFYLIGDDAVTLLDGTNGAQAFREQILPFLANSDSTETEVNIINPSDQLAFVTLRTYLFDGTVASLASQSLTLQPHAVYRKSSREILNSAGFSEGSYLSITSNVGLLAMELVENHTQPSLACLNGVNVNAAERVLNFPHAVLGGDYFSILGVINLLDVPQAVTVSLYRSDGTLLNTGSTPNPITVTLHPKATLRKPVVDLFNLNTDGTPVMAGWVKVESNFGPITGFVAYGNFSNPTLAAAAPQIRPLMGMVFSHMAPPSMGYFTGLALLNVNPVEASVNLTVVDRSGNTIAVRSLKLQPNEKIAQLVSDLLPEAKDQIGGSLVVESGQPLYGLELFGTTNFSVLANVPPDDISTPYTPLDPGKFVVTGKLTQSNGTPLSGAEVRLTGSIPATSVTTDDQGNYVFLNVPNGNFAVEPALKNFDFSPAAASVAVNGGSVSEVDFQGKRLPILAVTSISPPNGPLGSPVTLHGAGFSRIASENLVHFAGTLGTALVLKNPPPTEDSITVLVPDSARTGYVTVGVGENVSNGVQFSVTENQSVLLPLASATPSTVAISGLGNLALVGRSDEASLTLVNLAPNPTVVQNLALSAKAGSSILAVATDDDGTGGGTTRDDDIGFFNIDLIAFKALETKVALLGEKVSRPSMTGSSELTLSDVRFIHLPRGSEPVGLAFEPFGRFAISANRGTDSLSFIEFVGKADPVFRGNLSLPVGSKPVSVSVAANGRRALAANSGSSTVSVIEFAETDQGFLTGRLQPVVTRSFPLNASPTSVAINLDGSLAVTANSDNTASILNLNRPADETAITTVALPKFSPGTPSAVNVALSPNGSYAIVTSRDADGNAYLNVLSLEGVPEVAYVQVLPRNSGTSAVAIGPDSSSFLVANPRLGNVALFNPIRGSISVDTLSLSRARAKESITLFGSGFSTQSSKNVVRFRGKGPSTIPAPVLAVPSARQIVVEVPVDAVSGPVTVNVGNNSSNEQFFVVLPDITPNPLPVIQTVFPRIVSNRRDNTLLIDGSGFTNQSLVEVDLGSGNGMQPIRAVFPTASFEFVNSTRLQVFIPGEEVARASGSFRLDVFNPPPGGGRSSSVLISILSSAGGGGVDKE